MMLVLTTPWQSSIADFRFYRKQLIALGIVTVGCYAISLAPVAPFEIEVERAQPRFAEIILPEPKPIEAAVLPKPKPKQKEKLPEPKPKEQPVEKLMVAEKPQTVKQAREKAKVAGLLAFQDQLKAMREAVPQSEAIDASNLKRGSGTAQTIDRAILTSDSGQPAASVNVTQVSTETGGVALAGRESTRVEAPEDDTVVETGAVRLVQETRSGVRSIEEVRRVFDANKGAIFSIYNRALRRDPGLLGKVVLELVIEPDGTVSRCDVVSSELNSIELVERVMQRVQLFQFGERDVAVTRISYPVHFLPT